MNDEQYEETTVMIEEVGRLLGGMIRKVDETTLSWLGNYIELVR